MYKRAFSLIELLIVIVIIGSIYALAINNFNKLNDNIKNLNISNLKTYLLSLPYKDSAKLLCIDNCLDCSLYIDHKKVKKIDNFLTNNIKKYRYDYNYGYTEVKNDTFFNKDDVEEDVCFSFDVDKYGAGEQVLVEYNDKFYDFSGYFRDVTVYTSLDEATDAKEKLIQEVIQ